MSCLSTCHSPAAAMPTCVSHIPPPLLPCLRDPPPTPLLSLVPCPPRLQTLFRLQKVKESSWFWAPVKAEEAPGYFDVVRRPMDLATISDKVRARGGSGGGAAAAGVVADREH